MKSFICALKKATHEFCCFKFYRGQIKGETNQEDPKRLLLLSMKKIDINISQFIITHKS